MTFTKRNQLFLIASISLLILIGLSLKVLNQENHKLDLSGRVVLSEQEIKDLEKKLNRVKEIKSDKFEPVKIKEKEIKLTEEQLNEIENKKSSN